MTLIGGLCLVGELVDASLCGVELLGGVGGCRRRAHDESETHRGEHSGDSCNRAGMVALPAVKHEIKKAWKSVDKVTSEAFVGMWRARVAEFYSKYMATAVAAGAKQ